MKAAPPPAWRARVAAHLEANWARFHGRALAASVWGLARCGHRPGPDWTAGLIDATSPKLRSLDSQGVVMVAQALAAFGYSPSPDERRDRFVRWARWWELLCFAADARRFRGQEVRADED